MVHMYCKQWCTCVVDNGARAYTTACMYTQIHANKQTCIYTKTMNMCVCVCMYVCIRTHTHTHTHIYIYRYEYAYKYIHIHRYIHVIYIYIHTHTHTHTQTDICMYLCMNLPAYRLYARHVQQLYLLSHSRVRWFIKHRRRSNLWYMYVCMYVCACVCMYVYALPRAMIRKTST